MPNIAVVRNVMRPEDRKFVCLPHGMTLAEWVALHLPDRVAKTYINGEEASGAVAEGDVGAVVVYPADPISAAVGWIASLGAAQLAASVVLNLVVGALFKPKKPQAGNVPNASPVYSIGASQNQARLSAPIPVIYGTVVCTPDYAAQPVLEFDKNEQYLNALFCIGQGDHEVHDLMVGETSARSMTDGLLQWWVFPPQTHNSQFGLIEAATGVPENVFTSPDVAEQEIVGPDAVATASPIYWKHIGDGLTGVTAFGPVQMRSLQTDHTSAVGTKKFFVNDFGDSAVARYMEATAVAGAVFGPYDIRVDSYLAAGETAYMGAFEMCRPDQVGTEAHLDFVFPGGLYTGTSGTLAMRRVEFEVVFQRIDADGNAYFDPLVFTDAVEAADNTPVRFTRKWGLPSGRYSCKVRRTTLKATEATVVDRMVWTGLKFKIAPAVGRVYGDVTLVAVRLRATNGISGNASSRIRFKVTRKLPINGDSSPLPTRNPIDALYDMGMAQYGGRRPRNNSEFDLVALYDAHLLWQYHNGFNAIFDRPGTVWEAMTLALQTVAAVPLPIGSRISVAHDAVKVNRVAMFTENNIVAGSMAIQYEFAKITDPEAVRVEYRDPLTFVPAFVTLPFESDNATAINLFGCTDRTVAQQHAQLALNRQRLQRKAISFETEMEGFMVRHGDRIAVTHSLPRWGQSAQVVRLVGNVMTVSTDLDWTGTGHVLMLRDLNGNPFTFSGPVQRGASDHEIVLPTSLPAVEGYDTTDNLLIAFGPADRVTTDWIVTSMEPRGQMTVAIGAVAYDQAIYTGAMPHQQIGGTQPPQTDKLLIVAGTPPKPSADRINAGTLTVLATERFSAGTPANLS